MGFPHTLSGAAIFLSLFICIREPSVCDVVSVGKREDTGNETLGVFVCGGHYSSRVSSAGELFRLVFSVRLIYKVRRSLLPF